MERLDKLVASQGGWSRKESKGLIRRGLVTVDGVVIRSPQAQQDWQAEIVVDGVPLMVRRHMYLMLNKPAGVLSATRDRQEQTVLDLVPAHLNRKRLFPAGRLDKDTEGFVLLTDDGDLAHRILSPKRHVPKTYYVRVEGVVHEQLTGEFAAGVRLDGGSAASSAVLTVLQSGEISQLELTIYEGMYHQVKRMFNQFGLRVEYLRRIKIGGLALDPELPLGACRELSAGELDRLWE